MTKRLALGTVLGGLAPGAAFAMVELAEDLGGLTLVGLVLARVATPRDAS